MNWTTVSTRQPPPHQCYLVKRNGAFHTATPCYGMHAPWWVPMNISGAEYDPVNMLPDDQWVPLDQVIFAFTD